MYRSAQEFDNGCSEYDRKMRKEDEIRSQAEAGRPRIQQRPEWNSGITLFLELLNMEREEAELISRLKRAQEAQASAFSQLEAALIVRVAVWINFSHLAFFGFRASRDWPTTWLVVRGIYPANNAEGLGQGQGPAVEFEEAAQSG